MCVIFHGHTGPVTSVAFAPDALTAVSGGSDHTVRLWDLDNRTERRSLRAHSGSVLAVSFRGDGRHVLSAAADRTVRLWDAVTGRQLDYLETHWREILAAAFSADGSLALTAGFDRDADSSLMPGERFPFQRHLIPHWPQPDRESHRVRLWDLTTWRNLQRFDDGVPLRRADAFSPDGRMALDYELSGVYDLVGSSSLGSLDWGNDETQVCCAAFAHDNQFLLTGGWRGVLRSWDLQTGTADPHRWIGARHDFMGHTGEVNCVAVSPDGRHVMSGGEDATVRLWDAINGDQLRCWTGHDGPVNAVAFSFAGCHALSGGHDGTVRLWPLT